MNANKSKGVALITGASTGIGAAYAQRLAARGYDLILVARNRKRLDELAAKLSAETGVKAEVLPADLTAKSDLLQIEQRLRNDGGITVFINNAGMSVSGPMVGGDIDRLETMIQLNVVAATRLALAAAPGMVARGNGIIVNIASVVALAPEMASGIYSSSKAYFLTFSQALSREVATAGVRIHTVLPGATRTEIWERAGGDVSKLPPEMVMELDEMVDAAFAGLDLGEAVTIPSLPESSEWETLTAARLALAPRLSLKHAAKRYKVHA